MIGSDGGLTKPGDGSPHPRAFGTYPRVLGRYVRERDILTLEEAMRKMTSFPAARLGLVDRGLLKAGLAADITVFDVATITDKATLPTRTTTRRACGSWSSTGGSHSPTASTGIRAGRVLKGSGAGL